MNMDEMRSLDSLKTYKELEEAKNEIRMLKNIVKELEEINEYLRQKNDKLEYGRPNR
jgi:predicted nuclease with TOPRIM domain